MNRSVILIVLIIILYFLFKNGVQTIKEKFSMYDDDSRLVRYGDIITIWSPSVNKFIQADPLLGNKMRKIPFGKVNLSNSLISSEDIPSTMDWVQYMIVDANDPGDIGNTSVIKYGSPVYLKTVNSSDKTFLPTYISPDKNNNVYMSSERGTQQQLVFNSATGLQDSEIHYGDMITIKTWKSSYIHVSRTNNIILSNSNGVTRNFYVYDRFGQGKNMDWARRGKTAQSSTNHNLYSHFAIDGNMLTFSSTTKSENPWWEVTLPNDILISRIIVSNPNDTNQTQLSNFDIKLYDFDGTSVDTKSYDNKIQPKYTWENVNQIARRVRIAVNKNSVLNIADVRIYGQEVNYSVLLNEEMSKNLLSVKHFEPTKSTVFKHRILPSVSKNMSIMCLLEFNKLPTETSNVFIKSKNDLLNRTPNLLLLPPKINTNYSTLQYLVNTNVGNNELGENFMINYNVVPNKKFHFTAVHDAGINKNNGWFPCKFSKSSSYSHETYLCNFNTREFYKIKLEDSSIFKHEPILELENPENYGFNIMGLYNDKMSISTIKIYINGVLNTTYEVKSDIKYNTDSLVVGAYGKYNGFSGEMSYLKFSNRVIPQKYIQKESQILTGKLSINLLADSKQFSTVNTLNFDPNYLPEINSKTPEYTIHFWLNSQRPVNGTGNDDSIIKYGSEGIYFHPNSNTLYTKTKSGGLGIDDSVYKVDVDKWIHVAYVLKNKTLGLYINGKKTANKSLDVHDIRHNSFSVIKAGGFNGYLANIVFCNYGLDTKDLEVVLNNSPISEAIKTVRNEFYNVGCSIDPINISDPYVDNYNSSWLNLAQKGDHTKLRSAIGDFKKLADKGIATGDIINLKLAEKCYGKINVQNIVKSAKDLKTAKDSCKKYSINDFDIKQHKNFPKYVEKSKIRPPPVTKPQVIRLPPDPLKFISKDSKEYLDMKTKLDTMATQLKEMNNLKELIAKCKTNNDKLMKLDTHIKQMKTINKVNPHDNKLHADIKNLNKEIVNLQKEHVKDSKKLSTTLSNTIHADKLKVLKDNVSHEDKLKQSVEKTINNYSRVTPFSNGNGVTLDKDTMNLVKLENMVHLDLLNIDKKLDLLNNRINNKNKMHNLERAKLRNRIASIKQTHNTQ